MAAVISFIPAALPIQNTFTERKCAIFEFPHGYTVRVALLENTENRHICYGNGNLPISLTSGSTMAASSSVCALRCPVCVRAVRDPSKDWRIGTDHTLCKMLIPVTEKASYKQHTQIIYQQLEAMDSNEKDVTESHAPWNATGRHCTQAGAKGKTSQYFSNVTLTFCVHTSIGSGG